MKILLVDDDAFLRDMYATKFGEHGDEVVGAQTAQDALSLLADTEFDAIVSDMVMPGMTGIEFITAAKAANYPGTYIILSNQSEEHDKTAATAAGAAGYITKAAVVPSEVVTQVHSLVNKK